MFKAKPEPPSEDKNLAEQVEALSARVAELEAKVEALRYALASNFSITT